MTDEGPAGFRARLDAFIGQPMGVVPARAPDPVNIPMIRHWVDALDDRNPAYLDAAVAATTRFEGIVAPPAMLQTWTMSRPLVQGLPERGGAPGALGAGVLKVLDDAGFTATRATNSELEFARQVRLGDRLQSTTVIESISEEKNTALGPGYFVTWLTTYTDADDMVVGRQRFRVLKFKPGAPTGQS